MPRPGCSHSVPLSVFCALLVALGCEPKTEAPEERTNQTHPARRAHAVAEARLAANNKPKPSSDVPVRMARPAETQPAPTPKDIEAQVPDPRDEYDRITRDLAGVPGELDQIDRQLKDAATIPEQRRAAAQRRSELVDIRGESPRLLARLQMIQRPDVVRLGLRDAVRRALMHNNIIQVAAYAPAIDAARVVESEAQFDAVFFTNWNYDKQNRPAANQLSGTNTDSRVWQMGVRKLLSSGMQVQTGYAVTRTMTDLPFQTLNPSWFNQFFVEFKQPLLRGFGIDYNRSQIEIRKLDRGISEEKLRQQIRESIYNVEEAYWRLFRARRSYVTTVRLVTELETIVRYLNERLKLQFDVYKVQVQQAESRFELRMAELVRQRNQVLEAEDALKVSISDPDLNLAKDLEIIPSEPPTLEPLVLDVIGETAAALEYRSELHQARMQIEQAKIAIGVAKNQALPQLDLTFRYLVDGLGGNWDNALSQLSDHDFTEYLLQLQFEWPIGNRGPEAQLKQARLQQAQAIAQNKAQIEQVIFETQTAIRELHSSYDQIGPTLRSAQASTEQLAATKLRMERKDAASLQVELDAHELLASARQNLAIALAQYNTDLINLERRKGTLLQYNNIVLNPVHEDAALATYAPVGP